MENNIKNTKYEEMAKNLTNEFNDNNAKIMEIDSMRERIQIRQYEISGSLKTLQMLSNNSQENSEPVPEVGGTIDTEC